MGDTGEFTDSGKSYSRREARATSSAPPPQPSESSISVMLVGNYGTGKTSLVLRWAKGEFVDNAPAVWDAVERDIRVGDRTYQLHIWDSADRDAYHKTRESTYRGQNVVIIAYSVANQRSFSDVVDRWIPEVEKSCKSTPVMIAALQIDLGSSANGRTAAGAMGFAFGECSAKTGLGVEELFRTAASIAQPWTPPPKLGRYQGLLRGMNLAVVRQPSADPAQEEQNVA